MRVLVIALAFVSSAVFASDLSELLLQCRQINAADSRLTCYDQVASALHAHTGQQAKTTQAANTATAGSVVAPTAALQMTKQTTPAPVEVEFGKRLPRAVDEVASINSNIVKVSYNLQKKAIIQLENGQSWQQIENVQMNLTNGKSCKIKRAALGSFLLSCAGSSKTMRVKRLE